MSKLIVGWREWASLPELGVERIKAKLDTGARTGALHAWDIEPAAGGLVRFKLRPLQGTSAVVVACEAALIGERRIRASSGQEELRPVIRTALQLGSHVEPIELTLTHRPAMGFRLLLGRRALRYVLVAPQRSFVLGGGR